MSQNPLENESYRILGACIKVHQTMGPGFLEAVYQECLCLEFTKLEIPFTAEANLPIYYEQTLLKKTYTADFILFDQIILETKALKALTTEHHAQILNYLKATNLEVGLLVNFGARGQLEKKRFIHTNS